jgi:hypothetical protein
VAREREIPEAVAPAALLERERASRGRAGVAGIVAGLLLILGMVLTAVVGSGKPPVFLMEGLRDAAGQAIGREGLLTEQLRFLDDRVIGLVAASLLHSVSIGATVLLLVYLFDATRGRRPETQPFVRSLALSAGVALAVGLIAFQVMQALSIHDFVTGDDLSSKAGHDALRPSSGVVAQYLYLIGGLALGAVWVIISLNAMRVGLLTRFLGILGIFCGVLTVIPLIEIPVIQFFWLTALGLTILGKAPQGTPPAWTSGVAEPWPSQQEVREQRVAARASSDELEESGDEPSAASPQRKRRKRRG